MASKIEELKKEGYESVYIWDAKPNEEDLDHVHSFDTRLIVLEGEIEIRMSGRSTFLKSTNEIDIPKEVVHYGKAGASGCKYIVAEKHGE